MTVYYTDITSPTYGSDADNSSGSVTAGATVNASVYWQDNIALSNGIFRSNQTGSWVNASPVALSGAASWYNVTINTALDAGKTICWNEYANDTSGNLNSSMSQSAHCFQVTASNTMPYNITILNIAGKGNSSVINAATPGVTFEAYDLEQTTLNCQLYVDAVQGYGYNASVNNATATTINVNQTLGDGDHYVYANCSDGFLSNSSASWRFTVDTGLPSVAITSPLNNSWHNASFYLNWTAGDAHLDSNWTQVCSLCTNYTSNTTLTPSEGQHTATAYANDTAGNLNYTAIIFYYDVTLPQVAFTSDTNASGAYNALQLVNFSVSDNLEGLGSVNRTDIYVNGTLNTTCSGSHSFCNVSLSTQANSSNSYSVYAITYDQAGNSNTTATRTYTISFIPPAVVLGLPVNGTTFNNTQSVDFNFTATDDLNLTLNCSIYLDGSSNQTNSSTDNSTPTNFTIGGLSYASHYWWVNCSDGSFSNVSETRYFVLNYVPTLTLDVWDQTSAGKYDGDQTKYVNDNVTIYTNFTADGLPATGAGSGCNVTTVNHVNASMAFNSSNNFYYFVDNFSSVGAKSYNISCKNGSYFNLSSGAVTVSPQTEYDIPTGSSCNWTQKLEVVHTPAGDNNVTVDTITDRCNYYGYNGTVYVNVTQSDLMHTNITGANYSQHLEVAGLGSAINLTLEIMDGVNCTGGTWTVLQDSSTNYQHTIQDFNWADGETKCIRSNYSIDPSSAAMQKFRVVNSLNFTPIVAGSNSLGMHALGLGNCSLGNASTDCGLYYNGSVAWFGPVMMLMAGSGGTGTHGDNFTASNLSAYIAVEDSNYAFDIVGSCAKLWNASNASYTMTNKTVTTTGFYCFAAFSNSSTPDIFTAVKVKSGTYNQSCDGGAGCMSPPSWGNMTIKMHTDAPMQFISPAIDPYFDTNLHNVTVQVNSTSGSAVGAGVNVSARYQGGSPYGPLSTNASGQVLFQNIPSNGYGFMAFNSDPAAYNVTIGPELVNGSQVNYAFTIIGFDNLVPGIVFGSGTTPSGNYSADIAINVTATDNANLSTLVVYVNGVPAQVCPAGGASWANCTYTISSDGTYNVSGWVNDSAGHVNTTSNNSYVRDTTKPVVIVTSPMNNSVYTASNGTAWLNYTIIDTTPNVTWYALNGGANATITTNVTLSPVFGWNNVTLYANDSFGNQNDSGLISFYFDNVTPLLTVILPQNNTYQNPAFELNYTSSDAGINTTWYYLTNNTGGQTTQLLTNGASNVSVAAFTGTNWLTVSVNDSVGNTNATTLRLFIDSAVPQVAFNSTMPASGGYFNYTLVINVTSTDDTQLNYTWLTINGTNTTPVACGGAWCNITYSFVADGVYNVTGWANDTLGKISSTEMRTFTIDKTKPAVVLITYPVNGSAYSTAPNLTIIAADDRQLNATWFDLNGAFNYTNGNITALSPLLQGWNNVTAYANDSAGNQNNSAKVFFFFDNQAPQIDFYNSNASGFYNSQQVVNFSTTDANISAVVIYVNGTAQAPCAGPATQLYCAVTLAAPGNYSVYANATDNSGLSNWTASRDYTIDLTPPQLAVTSPLNSSSYNSTVWLNYSVIEAYPASYWYVFNGGAPVFAANVSLASAQGYNNVTVYANDSAGNLNNSGLFAYFYDDQAPQLAFAASANASGFYNASVLANFTVSDANLTNVIIYVNGTPMKTCSGNTTTYCNLTLSAPGSYNVSATAVDGTGLSNSTDNRTYVIDLTPPLLAVTAPVNNSYSASANVALNYSASDTYLNSVWYVLDAGVPVVLAGNTTLSGLSDLLHTLVVYANDSAGNQNSSGLIKFTVDTTKPNIIVASPLNGSVYNAANPVVLLNYSVIDANFNSSWFVLNGAENHTPGNVTLAPQAGWNTVTVFANDSAGNQNNSPSSSFYYDVQAPQYAANSSNSTAHNQPTLLSAYWTDNQGLAYAWLSTNNSGTTVNSTPLALSGTSGWTNFTITLNNSAGIQVHWGIYANDSAGNLNFTGIQTIITNNTKPVLLSNPSLNNYTPVVDDNITCTAGTYFDADGDAQQAVFFAWYKNGAAVAGNVTQINVTNYAAANNDNFSCSEIVFDGADNSTQYNSSNATIGATPDLTPPTSGSLSASNTQHGQSAQLSALWNDNSGVAFLNGSIFSTNNSGAWANSSFTTFPAGSGWSNYSLTLTSTNGATVGWRIYAVDLNGNWNDTGEQTLTTTNAAPLLTTNPAITPATAYALDALTCNAGTYSDANGDALAQSYWQWYKNGAVIASATAQTLSLETATAAAGDNFSCSQLVNDGYGNSTSWYNSTNRTIIAQLVPPVISSVASGSITASSAVISWTTDTLSNSTVYYSSNSSNLNSNASDSANTTSHALSLSSLAASTTYYYMVGSCDRYGNCANSTQANFTTSATQNNNGGSGTGTTTTTTIVPTATPAPTSTPVPTATPTPVTTETQQVLSWISPADLGFEGSVPADQVTVTAQQTLSQTTTADAQQITQAAGIATDPAAQQFIQSLQQALQDSSQQALTITTTVTQYSVQVTATGQTTQVTLVTLSVTSPTDSSDVRILQVVPKDIARSIADIVFRGQMPTILQSDPIFEWNIPSLSAGQKLDLSYSIKGSVDAASVKQALQFQSIAVAKKAVPTAPIATPYAQVKPTAAATPIAAAAAGADWTWLIIVIVAFIIVAVIAMARKNKPKAA